MDKNRGEQQEVIENTIKKMGLAQIQPHRPMTL